MTVATRQGSGFTERRTNLDVYERGASALAGITLTYLGLRRRSAFGLGVAALGGALLERGVTGHSRVYRAFGVDRSVPQPLRIVEAMQVSAPPASAYAVWRDLSQLPRFMKHLKSVTVDEGGRSRWVARFSGLPEIAWEAELVRDEPGEAVAWQSRPGADVDNAGIVSFRELPWGRGTGIRAEILYRPAAGSLGASLARLLSPLTEQQIREDIRRFKSLIEAREIPTTEGQPRGGRLGGEQEEGR
jgi:uncharacterized membrane protein